MRANAIILKKIKTGEAALVIHMLTDEGRRVAAFARGALKSKKRFAGILEPTHFISAEIKISDTEKLSVLQEAQLIDDFIKIRSSYDHIQLGLRIIECVGKVAIEDDHNKKLFVLLKNSLDGLSQAKNLEVYFIQFALKLFHQQGILDRKDWMQPFLMTPLELSESIPSDNFEEITSYHEWCQQELRSY